MLMRYHRAADSYQAHHHPGLFGKSRIFAEPVAAGDVAGASGFVGSLINSCFEARGHAPELGVGRISVEWVARV